MTIEVRTSDDMRRLGAALAAVAQPGDLVVLTGELGAGKTTLAQGIGAGLGVAGDVLSPTFVIARVHRGGRIPLVHADAYRLGSVEEIDDLDLDAALDESLTVVEWGAGLVERLAGDRLEVRIARPADDADETRFVTMHPVGASWTTRAAQLDRAGPAGREEDGVHG